MKLHFHPASSNSRKVLCTAHSLGIPLELIFVDLIAGEHERAPFLALNPTGNVPVLQDGDYTLWESNAIMQYLAARRPGNPLLPENERARADVLRWQFWEQGHWMSGIFILWVERGVKPKRKLGSADPAEIVRGEKRFHAAAKVLDEHLRDRDFLVGTDTTLADISVGAHLVYTKVAQLPLEQYKNIQRWFARIEALPAWQATAPPAA